MKKNETINAEELSKCYTESCEGYMGEQGYNGSNCDKHLYGAELAAEIRATLKKCNIKGVTVRAKTFAGGQEVISSVKLTDGDLLDWNVCKNDMVAAAYNDRGYWVTDPDTLEEKPRDCFFDWSGDKQARAMELKAREHYDRFSKGFDCNQYHFGKDYAPCFSSKFFERWNAIRQVVDSYNYDHSNSQVDYFSTRFYSIYVIKA